MAEIENVIIQSPNQWHLGNCQGIREQLLRLAVKYCENYATDSLILFESLAKRVEEDEFTLEVGFRQFGIDWPLSGTAKYRFIATITKVGNSLTLSGNIGLY